MLRWRCPWKGSCLVFCLSVLGLPAAQALDVRIAAQPLSSALRRFAEASGLQLVYVSRVVAGQQSPGSTAGLSDAETLAYLLRGTSLQYEFVNSRMVIIVDAAGRGEKQANSHAAAIVAKGVPDNAATPLDEVIVTAEKRREDLQKVTLSLTSVDGARLENEGRSDLASVLQPVPGVVMQSDLARMSVAIRGIGTNSTPSVAETTVALNADGVYNDLQVNTSANLFDLARVEVLRGPQGTLYGRHAAAGVVNIVTHDPVDSLQATGELEAGNYNMRHAMGVLNVPLGEAWSSRLAVNAQRHDGYLSNGQNDQDSRAARFKLRYQPDDKLSVLVWSAAELTHGSTGSVSASAEQPVDDWVTSEPDGNYSRSTMETVAARLNYDLGAARLSVLPAYQQRASRQRFNANGGLFALDSAYYQRSLELQLNESEGAWLKWLTGAYFYDASGILHFQTGPTRYSISSSAVFGQLTAPLGEGWLAVAGGRVTVDRKSRIRPTTRFTGRWTSPDYKLGLSYQLMPQSLAYVQLSTGHRPGGVFETQSQQFETFLPESILSWETGLKSRWFDERLQVNAALVAYDYRDFQVPGVAVVGGNPVNIYQNAPGASLQTAELEVVVQPAQSHRVELSLAWLQARFKSGFISNGIDYSGKPLENSPRFSGTLRHEYTWPVHRGWFTWRSELVGKTAYLVRFNNPSISRQPDHLMINLSSSFQSGSGRWQVDGYVRNVGNELVRTANFTTQAGEFVGVGSPRTYGLGVTVNY